MAFIEPVKRLFNTQEKRGAALITLIISLIVITPSCGYLFQCGCDWPWLGLDAKCNFHQPNIKHQCPWCVSMMTGILSTAIAIITGIYTSVVSLNGLSNQNAVINILIRIIFGLSAFLLIAIITAILAALWQGYPLPNHFNS